MPNSPADQPHTSTHPARRRGGQQGNLNALKHGLYSEQVTTALGSAAAALPGMDRLAVARRLHEERRREINRVVIALARLASLSHFHRERDAAVAEGRPLPPAPLLALRAADLKVIKAFTDDHRKRLLDERRRAAGLLTPDHPDLAHARSVAADYDQLIAFALAALHDAATLTPLPPAFAAHLTTPETNENPIPQSESDDAERIADPNLV